MTTCPPTSAYITRMDIERLRAASQPIGRGRRRHPHRPPRVRPPFFCCERAHEAGLLPALPPTSLRPRWEQINPYIPLDETKAEVKAIGCRCVLCGLSISYVEEEGDCWCHPKRALDKTKWPGGSLWDNAEEERARSFRERRESERKREAEAMKREEEARRREEKARQKRAAERKAAEDARLINRVCNFLDTSFDRVFNFLNTSSLSILFHPLLIIPWLVLFSCFLSYLFVCLTF